MTLLQAKMIPTTLSLDAAVGVLRHSSPPLCQTVSFYRSLHSHKKKGELKLSDELMHPVDVSILQARLFDGLLLIQAPSHGTTKMQM